MHTVLFHRNFRNFTGGHLKVWDYFNHVNTAPAHRAEIYFGPETVWDASNPWLLCQANSLPTWHPHAADLLFIGGHDWLQIPASERGRFSRPIVNLIQHVQHGDTANPLTTYLPHRAIRICVSAEVQAAILATGLVNGPTFVIPNGVNLQTTARPLPVDRHVDWLVVGVKEGQSDLARDLARQVTLTWGTDRVQVLTKLLPRTEFLAHIARSRRAVLLPRVTEGFYLPALEAMALGTLVICPDCIGNRSFCRDGRTAIVSASRAANALLAAMQRARSLSASEEAAILANAQTVAAEHSLANERAAFHELLAAVPSLW